MSRAHATTHLSERDFAFSLHKNLFDALGGARKWRAYRMKLHFEPDLDYQLDAIEAVCALFRGQEACRTEFTVTLPHPDEYLPGMQAAGGVGNRLLLLRDEVQRNLARVQLANGVRPTTLPEGNELRDADFTVEMETGTGKTYVYLRTVFELNKRFGFTKFVVVVPSVAIKEGVYKTLQITEEHFRGLYAGTPFEYFLYDSAKLGQVRNFATSPHIQIMVVTVGAINKKDVNNLYKDSEKTGGEKPIDLIRQTSPIIIVDEPQSVDGGLEGRGKEALGAMHPLCTLRYSATHADAHHMVYRLDAVDAYEKRLVKQIEVASATVEAAHNKPYVRLVSTQSRRSVVSAVVELDMATRTGGVVRREVTVQDGDHLAQVTMREVYADLRVGEIRAGRGEKWMELRFPGGEQLLRPGQAHGDVDALALQRELIRRTIREHLDKELRLRPQGIKVLSLFFIDEVARYRRYDGDGNPEKGEYAEIFEEEYRRATRLPEYQTLFGELDLRHAPEEVHDGYFSIDKRGRVTDTAENNQGNRENAERAYNLIMKDKERLLSFETPLKFIFSHSALREGWDNPNVFQICTLRDIRTLRERRQTIGRGLRLCVNQRGERLRGFEVNTLTVVANEAYEDFAANLQREIEEETRIRFGVVEDFEFASLSALDAQGEPVPVGLEASRQLWAHLKAAGYLKPDGTILDALREALVKQRVVLPEAFEPHRRAIEHLLAKRAGRLVVRNADERRQVLTRQAVLESAEFRALWDRVKHKTTYRVHFDNDALLERCVRAVRESPGIPRTRLQWRKASISIGEAGVEAAEMAGASTVNLNERDIPLPDVLTELQDRTQLTRRTLSKILLESGRLDDFRVNPQQYIQQTADVVNRCKRGFLVDGVRYLRLGDEEYFAQELFEQQELTGYLRNLVGTEKAVYQSVVCDSDTERDFALALERDQSVKVYAKLPGWFTVPTPLGNYNPDWAVLVEREGEERLYLVVETKESLFTEELRDAAGMKIACGREHFRALAVGESPARYEVATTFEDLMARI